MTTPAERTRALMQTRRLLETLTTAQDVPERVREEAVRLLRHYPDAGDVALLHAMTPEFYDRPSATEPKL